MVHSGNVNTCKKFKKKSHGQMNSYG